ncbi:hypothetical protein CRH09_39665 (plasmid) [Nocardia terpenica]|uniref:Uncharacterized protein n=1 Tax=Nocardia terpenica TaxID=455432 RepID=A0A291RY73_9NOCA|nr:hypothetical protein CRH09_39665 [Nocardia terpenica]
MAPGEPCDPLKPGDRVLWLNAAFTSYGEPLGILHGTVRNEVHPLGVDIERAGPWYEVDIEDNPWGVPVPRDVRADDLIVLPPAPAQEARRAG